MVGGRWFLDTFSDLTVIPVDASAWRDQLCRVQDRPFTEEERALLPPEADTDPPCRQG